MFDNFREQQKTRWHAFYTWVLGGYRIGWDAGQGLLNYLPQGALGLFFEFDLNSKIFQVPMLINRFFLGPLIGAALALLALIPALVEGAIFKRPYKKLHDEWTTKLVEKFGVKLFWGAMGSSALWLAAMTTGYIPIAINTALILPITISYGIVALTGIACALSNLYGSMISLYVYRTNNVEWDYTLKSLVNIRLDEAPTVKEPLNNEFIYETRRMSALYDEAYAQLVQQNNQAPTAESINRLGVLTNYGLQKDQSDFLKQLTKDKRYQSDEAKLAAIEERHNQFNQKYAKI